MVCSGLVCYDSGQASRLSRCSRSCQRHFIIVAQGDCSHDASDDECGDNANDEILRVLLPLKIFAGLNSRASPARFLKIYTLVGSRLPPFLASLSMKSQEY